MTKDCVRFAPLIGSREGELSPDDARALAAHLAGCETCRAIAADLAATDGLVADALLRSANARDFSTFADGVMEKLGLEERPAAAPARAGGLLAWIRGHRARATAAALVPVLAALLAVVYVRSVSGPGPAAMLELSSEGEATTVLETADGPVVLLQEEPGT